MTNLKVTEIDGFTILKWLEFQNSQRATISFPVLDLNMLMCAQHARLAAKVMFGREYTPRNAWDLRYSHNTVELPWNQPFARLRGYFDIGLS